MKAQEHPQYSEEIQQLTVTTKWISEQNRDLIEEDELLKREISSLKKEVSSALDERLILKQQMHRVVDEDLEKLQKIQHTPYFGRINFQEKHKEDVEVIYIGKFGLYDSKAGEMLVLDWRSPMANIYYSGMDEEVSYRTPKGMVDGKMHLKRRYVIEESKLEEIHDEKSLQDRLKESIEGDSEFLIDSLNKSTKGRLKEIVATIQDQQNKIIRSEANAPIVVQGVAGSGKTTIALHRMAYIIYGRQSERQAKYMVVAPNKLFLNYIEAILPDLGVENVFQTTFEEWAMGVLGKKYKLCKTEDRLDDLLGLEKSKGDLLALGAKFRGSVLMKRVIDAKLRTIEKNLVPKQHIMYDGIILCTYKEIQKLFLVSNTHMHLSDRIKQLGEYLKKRLKDKEGLIKQIVETDYRKRIERVKEEAENVEDVRQEIIQLFDERDSITKGIKKWINHFVKDYLTNYTLPSVMTFYKSLLQDEEVQNILLGKYTDMCDIKEMIADFQIFKENEKIEVEDLGALVYIQSRLYGLKDKEKYAHIVVDEAQDLDEMKLTVLRAVSANDAFTFVGDLSQGIYDYKGITNWERMMNRVFEDKKYSYFEMTTSYRSTVEIIDLANEVISHCTDYTATKAQPVIRHGEKPKYIKCHTDDERMMRIKEDILKLQKEGMHSLCILTRCKDECKNVYNMLKKQLQIQCLENEQCLYEGGLVVMPSYLSKGLEFDGVLLYDIGRNEAIQKPVDIKLLYVMVTRALHKLFMYSVGDAIEWIENSPYVVQEPCTIQPSEL